MAAGSIGRDNPLYGNIHVVWTRLYPSGQFPGEPGATGGRDIMIAVSEDGGQSWGTKLQDQGGMQLSAIQYPVNFGTGPPPGFAIPDQSHVTIGPQGDIYVSSHWGGNFAVHHSNDGAARFEGHLPLAVRQW